MARISMVLDGKNESKPLSAKTVLRAARDFLRLLNAVEESSTKQKAVIEWEVTIFSENGRATIVFYTPQATTDRIRTGTINEMTQRVKNALATS